MSGACLGALISTLVYPINTTKTHMQVCTYAVFLSVYHIYLSSGQKFISADGGPTGLHPNNIYILNLFVTMVVSY